MNELAKEAGVDELLTVHVRRVLNAPRKRVFAALTKPELVVKWWGPEGWQSDWAEIDLRPGGEFRMNLRDLNGDYDGVIIGTYLHVSPPHRLVFQITQHCNGAPELFDATKLAPTTVSIHLTDLGAGRTELLLNHSGFADAIAAQAHDSGWSSSFGKLGGVLTATNS